MNFAAAAALSGAGALTAAPSVNVAAAAGLSGTGVLTAAGSVGFLTAAALSGAGSLTAAALVSFAETVTLSGLGVLTASAAVVGELHARRRAAPAQACLGRCGVRQLHIRRGPVGVRVADPRRLAVSFTSAAALSGTGLLTPVALVILNFTPAVPLFGAGVLTVARRVSRAPGASLTGLGVLTATAQAGGTGPQYPYEVRMQPARWYATGGNSRWKTGLTQLI